MKKFSPKQTISKGISYVRSYWDKPKEGEFVSIKEFLSLGGSAMGIDLMWHTIAGISFSGGAMIIGMIMGVGIRDSYMIGIIGTIINYILMPFSAFIIDSLGQLDKKKMHILHTASLIVLGAALILWFVPQGISAKFDYLVRDLPKHIAIKLFFTVFGNYLGTYTLRWFGRKYGKFKPFILFFGVPTLLAASIIVFLPYQAMNYSTLLIVLHVACSLLGLFSGPFNGNLGNLQAVMTNNPEERTRIYSLMPMAQGLLRSLFLILLPMIAQPFGGQLNIASYRFIIPIVGGAGLLESFLVLRVKDRVVQPEGHKPDLKIKGAVKEAFTNKYNWIVNISGLFVNFVYANDNAFNWIMLYGTRLEWMMGLLLNISYLPATPGNLFTPWLLKRMDKRTALLTVRIAKTALEILLASIIFTQSDMMKVAVFLIFSFIGSFLNGVDVVISNTINPDIWDYTQWKTGERLETSLGLFAYLSTPLGMLLGLISPFVLKLFGLVRDWDILYDRGIRNQIISVHMVIAIVGSILTLVPFFFYDLTTDKMRKINEDLHLRAQAPVPAAEGGAEVCAE